MPDVAVTIIGGGIVGCAVAARSAAAGLATVLLERGPQVGVGTRWCTAACTTGPTRSRRASAWKAAAC